MSMNSAYECKITTRSFYRTRNELSSAAWEIWVSRSHSLPNKISEFFSGYKQNISLKKVKTFRFQCYSWFAEIIKMEVGIPQTKLNHNFNAIWGRSKSHIFLHIKFKKRIHFESINLNTTFQKTIELPTICKWKNGLKDPRQWNWCSENDGCYRTTHWIETTGACQFRSAPPTPVD